eukprot:scaffold4273_cov106-Isochrysis_galbana.AAC.4
MTQNRTRRPRGSCLSSAGKRLPSIHPHPYSRLSPAVWPWPAPSFHHCDAVDLMPCLSSGACAFQPPIRPRTRGCRLSCGPGPPRNQPEKAGIPEAVCHPPASAFQPPIRTCTRGCRLPCGPGPPRLFTTATQLFDAVKGNQPEKAVASPAVCHQPASAFQPPIRTRTCGLSPAVWPWPAPSFPPLRRS